MKKYNSTRSRYVGRLQHTRYVRPFLTWVAPRKLDFILVCLIFGGGLLGFVSLYLLPNERLFLILWTMASLSLAVWGFTELNRTLLVDKSPLGWPTLPPIVVGLLAIVSGGGLAVGFFVLYIFMGLECLNGC